jgi:hypothetical protein
MTDKFKITTRSTLRQQAISEIIGVRELIKNRDVGDIVASPLPEYVKRNPYSKKVTVFLFSSKEPPFYQGNYTRAIINLPDIKTSKIDWQTIKTAVGGANGYLWGRFRGTVNLSNNRQLAVYAGSKDEASDRLDALLSLLDVKQLTRSVTEEQKTGERSDGKPLQKKTTRVYPAYFTVINSQKVSDEYDKEIDANSRVTSTLQGRFKRTKTEKIPLWTAEKPPGVDEIIREALINRGD